MFLFSNRLVAVLSEFHRLSAGVIVMFENNFVMMKRIVRWTCNLPHSRQQLISRVTIIPERWQNFIPRLYLRAFMNNNNNLTWWEYMLRGLLHLKFILNTPHLSFAFHVTICRSLMCPGFCHEINSVHPEKVESKCWQSQSFIISEGDEQEYGC